MNALQKLFATVPANVSALLSACLSSDLYGWDLRWQLVKFGAKHRMTYGGKRCGSLTPRDHCLLKKKEVTMGER